MEKPESFLELYHNNNPNDWLYQKRDVVCKLLTEYASQFQQPKKETKTIDQRKNEFALKVDEFKHGDFKPDEELYKFFDYWTEISPNGKKMRFEKEKVFDIKKRLERWKRNQKNFNNGKPEKRSTESAAHSFITD